MNLREFLDQTRVKIVEKAQAVPEDREWSMADAWVHYDVAIGEMLAQEIPKSIELDPE